MTGGTSRYGQASEPAGQRKELHEALRDIDEANRAPPELAGASLREVAEGAALILDAIAKHHEGTGTGNIAHGTATRLRIALSQPPNNGGEA